MMVAPRKKRAPAAEAGSRVREGREPQAAAGPASRPAPDPPAPVSKPGLREVVMTFARELARKSLGTYASSTTYCMLLSFFPALILVSTLLPYTALSEGDVVGLLLTILPDASAGLVRRICSDTYQSSVAALPASIILMLWSAGFGMMQLTRGLNTINDAEEGRNYFLMRLVSTLYTLLVLLLMVAVLLLQIFARQLIGLWESVFPGSVAPEILTSAGRYVVLFIVAIVLFVLLYSTLPAERKTTLSQLPGAVMAAVGWEAFSAIFKLYVGYSQNLTVYYGSLISAIVLLLWVYWCVYIMLVGAFLNRFLEVHVLPGGRWNASSRASA